MLFSSISASTNCARDAVTVIANSEPNFESILKKIIKEHITVSDFAAYQQQQSTIHQFILEVNQSSNRVSTAQKLSALIVDPENGSYEHELKLTLDLISADLTHWIRYFTAHTSNQYHSFFSIYGAAGHILESLPDSIKYPLLLELGKLYKKKEFKREVTNAIHILLNPKKLFKEFQSLGKTNFEFYDAYLALLRNLVFPNSKIHRGYNAELIMKICKLFQDFQIARTHNKEIERDHLILFGSVPNGFGRNKSDYDLFNYPRAHLYPESMQESAREAAESMGRFPDPFENYRYQIEDSTLQENLATITAQTPWKGWHLENKGEHAHEHFGSQTHIFSFHITRDNITLRFYDNYLNQEYNVDAKQRWTFKSLEIN